MWDPSLRALAGAASCGDNAPRSHFAPNKETPVLRPGLFMPSDSRSALSRSEEPYPTRAHLTEETLTTSGASKKFFYAACAGSAMSFTIDVASFVRSWSVFFSSASVSLRRAAASRMPSFLAHSMSVP